MKCPICEERKLTKIKFKSLNKKATLCDLCGIIWHEGEPINEHSGHILESQIDNNKQEYSFDDIELDQESHDFKYAKFK
jgi:hypothetical protein